MENRRRMSREELAGWLIVGLLLIAMIIISFKLVRAENKLAELERGTSEQMTSQQAQIDSLGLYIEGVRDEMQESFEDQKEQLERQQEQLDKQKNIQSNTNKALTRLIKKREEVEQELREGLEMRRRWLEEQRALARRGGSQSASWSFTGEYIDGMASIGVFQLTAYEWSGYRCKNGEFPKEGITVASNLLPLGTRVYIEGIGERVVEDTGGMGLGVIDVYLGDYYDCIQFGRQQAEVYVLED